MALVSMKDILNNARRDGYGIGSFNVIDLQMISGIIEAAELENSPVIIAFAEAHNKYLSKEKVIPIMVSLAREARVPVSVILDHGQNYKSILEAIKLGVSGVMFDGSQLTLDENIKKTKEIVKIAHSLGVTVEAELGHVSTIGGCPVESVNEIESSGNSYTDPKIVEYFIEETEVDVLAISFGTAHGIYDNYPELNLQLLNKINKISKIPLVMHGGSGLEDIDYVNIVKGGISKVNYYSNLSYSIANAIKEKINKSNNIVFYHDIVLWTQETIKKEVRQKIKLFRTGIRP